MDPTPAVHTTKALHNASIFASLGLNTQLFVFQLINFLVISAIIWWLILKPLNKKLEERKQLIDESVDNAKEIETNLWESEQKFQEHLDQAKVEANKIIAKATKEAGAMENKIKDEAKTEIEYLITQAKKHIEDERKAMEIGVQKKAGKLVVAAVEKLISKKMDDKKDTVYISKVLSDLSK